MANDKMKKGSKTVDPIKSKREIQAVKNYLSGKNSRDYTIFVVGINSALRVSDVVKLKWENRNVGETPYKNHIIYSKRMTVPSYDSYFELIPAIGEDITVANPELKCTVPAYCFIKYLDNEYKDKDINIEFCEAVEKMGSILKCFY
ncbi:hypothetical protein [Clostridium tagluense]|uniref:hypothetical protein n=1 Tax=Clostridium tagluense TaxID=360422 RepID=UPI0027151AB1|nr:hypothetical protein [Clostridium tagluense]